MTSQTSDFLADMRRRGMLHASTDEAALSKALATPLVGYAGFDPTADSLHIGHLVPLLALRRLQAAGHRPIAVVGGGTALVGDPSGKVAERDMVAEARIRENAAGVRRQMERFLDFSGSRGALLHDNYEWLGSLRLLDFLRDIGKHFSVNEMIARDAVRIRLEQREQGISFTEFSYILMQSFDYLHLFDEHGCTFQIGGSDQWGNIVSGADLIRRLRGATVHGMTFPLVKKADGTKFGKTETGTVWIDPKRTSPYQFLQFWLNAPDADAIHFLHYFTELTEVELEALKAEQAKAPAARAAQKRLAREVTTLVHGKAETERAERVTEVLFGDRAWTDVDPAALAQALADAPSYALPRAALGSNDATLPAVLASSGLAPSRREGRTLVEQGAVTMNGVAVKDVTKTLAAADFSPMGLVLLRRGRKNYSVIRLAD